MATLLVVRLRELLENDLQRGTIRWNVLGTVNRADYARQLGVSVRALPLEAFLKYDDLGPRQLSKSDQLRSILERDYRSKCLATWRPGLLNKLHYGKLVGFINTGPYEEIFAHFQSLLEQPTIKESLYQLLAKDHADGKIVFSKQGKINRKHYADLIGVTKSALAIYRPMIEEFEELEGGAKRFKDRDIREMREWLEREVEKKSLRFNREGKISRKQFRHAFAIFESDFQVRFPELGELLSEYDQRAVDAYANDDRLRRILENRVDAPVELAVVSKIDWRGKHIEREPSLRKHQFYKPESKEAKLVEVLNEHFEVTSTVPVDVGFLARQLGVKPSHFYKGCKTIIRDYELCAGGLASPCGLSPASLEMVSRYPQLERHQYYRDGSTKAQLVDAFNRRHLAGGIPRNSSGGIQRTYLTKEFGLSHSAMSGHLNLIQDYETATGVANHHDLRLPEIRAFIETSIGDGTLDLTKGRINKSSLFSKLGLPPQPPTAAISALIREFDEWIAEHCYTPNDLRAEIDRLVAALKDNPPLEPRKGQSYNRKRLAVLTGIPLGRLKLRPFTSIIREADDKLRQQLETDDLCYVIEGHKYSFHTLLDFGWSRPFAARMAKGFYDCFMAAAPHKRKSASGSLREFFQFLAQSNDATCRRVCHGFETMPVQSIAAADWAECTTAYRRWLEQREDLKGGTSVRKINDANGMLRHLANKALLPELEMPLKIRGRKRKQHRRTLAQEGSKEGVDDYLAFATARLRDAATLREIQIDVADEAGFLKTLRQEISRGVRPEDDTPAKVILYVLKRRMKLLTDAFNDVCTRWQSHYRRGQELLARGLAVTETWLGDRFTIGARSARNVETRRIFPLEDPEQGLANLLRLISDHFGGIYPRVLVSMRN